MTEKKVCWLQLVSSRLGGLLKLIQAIDKCHFLFAIFSAHILLLTPGSKSKFLCVLKSHLPLIRCHFAISLQNTARKASPWKQKATLTRHQDHWQYDSWLLSFHDSLKGFTVYKSVLLEQHKDRRLLSKDTTYYFN